MKISLFIFFAYLLTTKILFGQNLINDSLPTVKGINRISLSVRNLDSSINFYTTALDIEEVKRFRIKNAVAIEKKSGIQHFARNVALLKGPNGFLELIQFDATDKKAKCKTPVEGPGITHVCYQASVSNSIYTKSKAIGASVISRGDAPVNRGFGVHYAYIRDLDGIMFEVEQLEKVQFNDKVWIGHVALVSPNIDRLVEFYTQLLGIKPHRRIDDIKNNPKLDDIANIDSLKLRAAWFKTDNMILEMWQFDNPATKATNEPAPFTQIGYQKIAFEVGNLENEYQRMKKAGTKFFSEPLVSKNEIVVYLRDPDGNLISLHQFKTESDTSIDKLKRLSW